MTPVNHEGQLELFDVAQQPAPRPHRETWGRMWLQLRYDQLVLTGIGGLLGIAVIFAFGVERGKQLARTERPLLARVESSPAVKRDAKPAEQAERPSTSEPVVAPAAAKPATKPSSITPSVAPKKKEPARVASKNSKKPAASKKPVASGKSRYAIQVVTFAKAQLAKQELDRLLAKGEPAFLVMREGRTMVYIGPFSSKGNASERLSQLKSRYQDCFVKTL